MILAKEKDAMGAAIADYHAKGRAAKLRVLSSMFDEDEFPVPHLFRSFEQMPRLEQTALRMASGQILDVGAAAGCHTLALQQMGKTVTAIDISPLSIQTMKRRGVADARLIDLFDPGFADTFDTVLMLMNGSSIIGNLDNMERFFLRMKALLCPGASILMDSSDIKYVYQLDDGSYDIPDTGRYYGVVDYRMQYKNIRGDRFDCLYTDFDTLAVCARQFGFQAELVERGDHFDYLAQLTPTAWTK